MRLLPLLLAILPLHAAPDASDWTWNDPRDLGVAGLSHRSLASEAMGREVGFQVYLPPAYEADPERRFPVVYFLHGAGGTESSDAGLAATVHAEIEAGAIDPAIYVFPNGGKRSGYRDWPDTDIRPETWIIRELIPHLDRELRTVARPEGRAICGFSMGGGGATRLFFKYPELFGALAGLAPALDRSADEHDGDNAYAHASAYPEARRGDLRPYFVIGDGDFLLPRQQPFQQHLTTLGIDFTYVLHTGVDHNLGKLKELSATALIRHLDRQLKSPRP